MELKFQTEKTKEYTPLDRHVVEKTLGMRFLEGMCAADKINPENSSGMRTIREYMDTVILQGIEQGKIGDGIKSKWDDRKLRFDSATISRGVLEVRLGVSYFGAIKEDLNRNPEENLRLQKIGEQKFNNRYALFERGPGVTVIPITKDGSIFLAERKNVEGGVGLLNGAAGNMEYKEKIEQVNPEHEARKEFHEEMGVSSQDIIALKFVGLYASPNTGEVDFTYLAPVTLSDKELMSAWDTSKDKVESGRRIHIPDFNALEKLLYEGVIKGTDKKWELMYATSGGLASIFPEEMNN